MNTAGGSHLEILKTVREKGTVYKLDQPVNEIFSRMRGVSKKFLDTLDPNTFYLTVSVLQICAVSVWNLKIQNSIY